jgi:hypothetical protein
MHIYLRVCVFVCVCVTLSLMWKDVHPDRQVTYIMAVETLLSLISQIKNVCWVSVPERLNTDPEDCQNLRWRKSGTWREYTYWHVQTTSMAELQRWTQLSHEAYQHWYYNMNMQYVTNSNQIANNWWINVYLSGQRNYFSIRWIYPILTARSCFHFVVPRFLLNISEYTLL